MSKAKIAALLSAILVLSPGMGACGFTSQGSQEQQRPAERQNSAEEDAIEENKEPQKVMEETGKDEETEEGKEAEK